MLLEVNSVEVRYGRVPAIRDVSFHVSEGEIVCFIGPNGAGKSTTMLAVAGVLHPAKGSIVFEFALDLRPCHRSHCRGRNRIGTGRAPDLRPLDREGKLGRRDWTARWIVAIR